MSDKADAPETSQKKLIKEAYGKMAEGCGPPCCSNTAEEADALKMGYSPEDLERLPEGAFLGLSCGNPLEEAALKAGETVLDLGSGGGHDALLVAQQVGPTGRVIGVDMTPAMVDRARKLAEEAGFRWVEFREGDIEALPLEGGLVDVVISNCVINLSPDKGRVFREVYRVLKPGGRMVVSDIVLRGEIPEALRGSAAGLVACLANAVGLEEYLDSIRQAKLELDSVTAKGLPQVLSPDTSDPVVRELLDSIPDAESLLGLAQSVTISASKSP